MRSVMITLGSFALTAGVITNAYLHKKQFYPSVVYITKSSPSMAVLYLQALVLVVLLGKIMRQIFFSQLRSAELEHLIERSWYAVTETCLAFTVFRDDFSPRFVALFTILLFLKCFHWLAEDRIDYMERSPVITWLFHLRAVSLLCLLGFLDALFVNHAYSNTLYKGPSVQLVFGFEYAILLTVVVHVFVKYVLHTVDLQTENPWENKAVFLLYAELALGFVKCVLYLVFLAIMIKVHTFPLFVIRPMYLTIREFKKALNDVVMSRRAIRNMNTLYPDATEEDLTAGDNVCIICREEMHTACKKLPCNHIFHSSCLRSWFQRQQTCPTCRMDVLRQTGTAAGQAAAAARQAAAAAAAPQQPQPAQQAAWPAGAVPPGWPAGLPLLPGWGVGAMPGWQPPAPAVSQAGMPNAPTQGAGAPGVAAPLAGFPGWAGPQAPPAQLMTGAVPGIPAFPETGMPSVSGLLGNPFPPQGFPSFTQFPHMSSFPYMNPMMTPPYAAPPFSFPGTNASATGFPAPCHNLAGLSDEELRHLEGNERSNVEARVQCLQDISVLLTAALTQMQQYTVLTSTQPPSGSAGIGMPRGVNTSVAGQSTATVTSYSPTAGLSTIASSTGLLSHPSRLVCGDVSSTTTLGKTKADATDTSSASTPNGLPFCSSQHESVDSSTGATSLRQEVQCTNDSSVEEVLEGAVGGIEDREPANDGLRKRRGDQS